MNPILIEDAGPIRTITLNRPSHRNALSPTMQRDLISALNDAACSSLIRVLVITGAGEAFCAGLDLASLERAAQSEPEPVDPNFELFDDAHRIATILRRLYELPIPTIAAVNGHAIAGGTGIATVCDFTLAVPAAKFGYTEVRIGFIPALVSIFLTMQVGEKRARELLLTGRLFQAEEAHRLGLVTEVVAAEDLAARTRSLAETLIANSPASLAATKALLADQHRAHLDAAIPRALAAGAGARRTADFREGISAFLEKRKPRWSL